MAAYTPINVGTVANDHTGDPFRTAWIKTNGGFDDVYTQLATKIAQSVIDIDPLLAANSDAKLASQKAVKSAIAAAIAALGTAATKNTGTGAGNVPILDGSGLLDTAILPALAISDVSVVASQAAMLALTAQRGDIAVRTDLNKSFILSTNSPSTLADWKELLTPTNAVLSVATLTGAITAAALKTAISIDTSDITDATANGRSLISAANYSAMRTLLGLIIGTDVQAYNIGLAAIAGLTSAASKVPYFTGLGAAALADFMAASVAVTPTLGSTGTAPSLGNGTLTGRAAKIGGFVWASFTLNFGSTTSFGTGNIYIQMPSPYNGNAVVDVTGALKGVDLGTANRIGVSFMASGSNLIKFTKDGDPDYWSATIPQTWAVGDSIIGSILIPVA